jgi:pyrimidine dimer DNA glycosylase
VTDTRLWSLHLKYLAPQRLVALWREALARKVLPGDTQGYGNHPELVFSLSRSEWVVPVGRSWRVETVGLLVRDVCLGKS